MSAATGSASWSARPRAGAGFRNELVPVAGGFVLSVSVGRAVLASTGRDWEAVGLAPTVPDRGRRRARRRPCAGAAPARRRRRRPRPGRGSRRSPKGVAARGERRTPALPLAAYAGSYGERVLSVEDGRLYYRRGTRAAHRPDPARRQSLRHRQRPRGPARVPGRRRAGRRLRDAPGRRAEPGPLRAQPLNALKRTDCAPPQTG